MRLRAALSKVRPVVFAVGVGSRPDEPASLVQRHLVHLGTPVEPPVRTDTPEVRHLYLYSILTPDPVDLIAFSGTFTSI